MVEKILFEYMIDSNYSSIVSGWDRITITDKEVYIYRTSSGLKWSSTIKKALEVYANKKEKVWILEDLQEIYNKNIEIISGYEGLKNKFLEYLNS